uniref:SAM domain-containing protein n=1 Tax=Guillardia theta TaxID=55529 RepID=A0A7S4NPJ2_GUITH|mmetsp:Transcript_27170/g.88811  ORF Transcript_27170/g.88811 Transcript_27170/m.88811 type:complete len:580 (+) Transcript_27170:11-1750(+)
MEGEGNKRIRFPTETSNLQIAVDLCDEGGCIEILPGTYFVNAIIMKDLTLRGMGDQNNTALVSRFCCTLVIESCKVNLENLTLAVSEGTLTDHAMELHEASVTMESCDVYGGTAALFANSNSKIAATHCQYHDAHSFGVALMNSEAEFLDCYFFRNGEDGCNIGGSAAKLELQNCRISDNTCFGVHVHDGASMAANKCNVIKNEQAGVMISGHDSNHLKSTGIMKQSCAEFQDCRIKLNKWQGIFVLDGSLKCVGSDLRHNERGALVLTTSKTAVISDINRLKLPYVDVEYYESCKLGEIELADNKAVRKDAELEFTGSWDFPQDWKSRPKDEVLEIYKKCSIDLQKRLHNYPNGWEDRILRDPKAYMLIERLFRNIEQETDTDIDELDMEIHEFLQDLGLERFVERFRKLDCNAVRDLLPMRDTDFVNIGIKDTKDRRKLNSRIAALSGASHAPQHLVPCKFASLIEATKFQARKADKQRNYEEWKKLRSLFADRIGFNTTGADVDTKLRKLFSELDVSRTAGQRGIHVDELKKGLQNMGVKLEEIRFNILMSELDSNDIDYMSYESFCKAIEHILRT